MKKSVVVSSYQNVEFPTDCEHTVTTLNGKQVAMQENLSSEFLRK